MILVGVLALACGSNLSTPQAPSDAWARLLGDYLERHPAAGAEDVYKRTHQSVFGPAHLITDREAARRYLAQEIATLAPGRPDEPMLDVLSEEPPLVRVNLRPFIAGGGDPAALLDALVSSANQVRGEETLMTTRLVIAAGVLRQRHLDELAEALDQLTGELRSQGYPAGHHSPGYLSAYRPAYRVVLLPLIQPALPPAGR